MRIWDRVRGAGLYVRYEAAFFLVMLVYFWLQVPGVGAVREDGWWLGGFWYLTYSEGFVGRGLVGSVVALFGDKLAPQQMNVVIGWSWVVAAGLVAWFCGWVVRGGLRDSWVGVLYVVSLFVVVPCSYTQYCNSEMFGKLDMFHLPLLILAGVAVVRQQGLAWLLLLVAAGVLIHPSFLFLYVPGIMVMVGGVYGWRRWRVWGSIVVVAVVTMVVQGVWGRPVGGMEGLGEYLLRRSGEEWALNHEGFRFTYYATVGDHWQVLMESGGRYILNALVVYGTVLLPVWLLPVWLLLGSRGRGGEIWLIGVCAVPVFITLDWTRWISSLVLVQYVIVFVFYLAGAGGVRERFVKLERVVRARPWLAVGVLLWFAVLPRTEISGLLLPAEVTALLERGLELVKIF